MKCLPIAVPTSETLYAVTFVDEEVAVAAGASGTLLRSIDAGRTWRGRALPTDSTVFGLAFAQRVGVAVGSGGTLLRTEDAGENWARLPSLGRAMLHGVSLHPSGFGVAAGQSGRLWITQDLGATWERRRLWTRSAIRRVQIVSSDEAWAVGDEGLLLVGRDRGRHWKRPRLSARSTERSSPPPRAARSAGRTFASCRAILTRRSFSARSRIRSARCVDARRGFSANAGPPAAFAPLQALASGGRRDPFVAAEALRGLARLCERHSGLPEPDWEKFFATTQPVQVRAAAAEVAAETARGFRRDGGTTS